MNITSLKVTKEKPFKRSGTNCIKTHIYTYTYKESTINL